MENVTLMTIALVVVVVLFIGWRAKRGGSSRGGSSPGGGSRDGDDIGKQQK